ncbi:hypothetical protein GmHk_02G004537 [Glycine max]|nr:hypothetical protein GmHk_02G004537 [Glycine max]
MSNQKSTESAIKNLEVQVGQLTKQLVDRPSSSFSANTKKNLKEECKAVMTRSRMANHVDERKSEKKIEEHKQQLVDELALEPVDDLIELEEIVEEAEGDEKGEISIKDYQERIKKEEKEEETKENEEKVKKLKNEKQKEKVVEIEKKKGKSEANSEKKKEATHIECKEAWERYTNVVVPRKLLPERNVILHHTEFDEYTEELEGRNWHKELKILVEGSIDVAIVKEFYANLYGPEDKPSK